MCGDEEVTVAEEVRGMGDRSREGSKSRKYMVPSKRRLGVPGMGGKECEVSVGGEYRMREVHNKIQIQHKKIMQKSEKTMIRIRL